MNKKLLLLILWLLLTAKNAESAQIYVSTSSELQSALDNAQPGDEIIVADGTYNAEFDIDQNNGTAANPIIVRAENLHQAAFVRTDACSTTEYVFDVKKAYWIIRDFEIKDAGKPFRIRSPSGGYVEIRNNLIHSFRTDGIRIEADIDYNKIYNNVIAFGDACQGEGNSAIYLSSSSNNEIVDNIIIGQTNNGYAYGTKYGYGIMVANNAEDNLIKGNLIIGSAKAQLRMLAGEGLVNKNNVARDNVILWGEGPTSTSDCADEYNDFINNIFVGNYFWNLYTKGNDGGKGHHDFFHNFIYLTDFSRSGVGMGAGGCGGNKEANNLKDNLFYSDSNCTGQHYMLSIGNEAVNIDQADHNLFYAPGGDKWVSGYTYDATDLHSESPIFNDAANGDFSLAVGSPGKNAASDGKDIGIEYNRYLKKAWLHNAFNLETQQKDSLGTSTSFTVSPNHWYQVWFYIPEPDSDLNPETFTIEGTGVDRDIAGLTDPTGTQWVQPGGPARWITLGRHKATDGTLNISWTDTDSCSKIFIRRLPTPPEAYSWISFTSISPDPTVSLTADPTNIISGESSTLYWTATNADSCTASGGWSGTKPLSGSEYVSPTSTSSYTLTCENSTDQRKASDSVTVSVTKPLLVAQALLGIDAITDDWTNSPTYTMEDPHPTFPVPSPSPADLSASFRAAWDSSYLYILAEVTDEEYDIDGGSKIYHHDGIEIMIDGLNDHSPVFNSDDHQIFIRADGETYSIGSTPGYIIASTSQTSNGYLVEAAINWFFIAGQTPAEGILYGFDIDVNDRDNETRESQVFWKYVPDHHKNASQYDDLELILSIHRADTNQDGCTETNELLTFINRWKISSKDVPMPELMEAIGLWKSGTGCN
jgi:hypothetical protein